jgi:hypothetical protein
MMRQNNFRSNCLKEPIQAVEDLGLFYSTRIGDSHVAATLTGAL